MTIEAIEQRLEAAGGDVEETIRKRLSKWQAEAWPKEPPFFSPNTMGAILEELAASREDVRLLLAVAKETTELLRDLADQANECPVCGVRYKDGAEHLLGCSFNLTGAALDALESGEAES